MYTPDPEGNVQSLLIAPLTHTISPTRKRCRHRSWPRCSNTSQSYKSAYTTALLNSICLCVAQWHRKHDRPGWCALHVSCDAAQSCRWCLYIYLFEKVQGRNEKTKPMHKRRSLHSLGYKCKSPSLLPSLQTAWALTIQVPHIRLPYRFH
ncbi:hypothetical protein BC939DRAFT_25433 [Gamsiella multidivaricata]|uniref:uncharacterized protein n=1 Tax=Gamsiella multidivaricata TaxID=101098 RepID=UPI00221FF911|nr:uncharacterized protein BC939DRAFT_25433 [Gamsiella multidivaricata]KAI7829397.1 hypothetical protein BC939DRAFT_25433 [Gamsiella multidivaricata]